MEDEPLIYFFLTHFPQFNQYYPEDDLIQVFTGCYGSINVDNSNDCNSWMKITSSIIVECYQKVATYLKLQY